MLVVIGIIAVLAGLVTPVVMAVRSAASVSAIKTEIDLIQAAFEEYKSKYGELPPCFSEVTSHGGDGEAVRHLNSIFPRLTNVGGDNQNFSADDPRKRVSQTQLLAYLNFGPGVAFPALGWSPWAMPIRPDNAIAIWLRGYTSDPRRPVLSTSGSVTIISGTWGDVPPPYPFGIVRQVTHSLASGTVTVSGDISPRMKVFDFDESRINSVTAQYYPPGLPQSPYHYIDSSRYATTGVITGSTSRTLAYTGTTAAQLSAVGAQRVPRRPLPRKPTPTTPDAWYFTTVGSGANEFFNPNSFQILCAGGDGIFGTDDDLSNFWKGTRRDYLDSLRSQ
jgi:type II secretory pathway pseudopilin PulG